MTLAEQRGIVRELADRVVAESKKPVQAERIRLWQKNNDLTPERPMVWINEIPWKEIENSVPELVAQCTDPTLREIEQQLRRTLFTANRLETDEVVQGVWYVPFALDGLGLGLATREELISQGDSPVCSHHYQPVIADYPDIEKLEMPCVRHDSEATLRRVAYLESLFGDLLPVSIGGNQWNTFFAPWDDLVRWTGVNEALLDLYERPDFLHALMRRITDVILARQTQLEELGVLATSNRFPRVGSGAAGYTTELPHPDLPPGKIRLQDVWGYSTAQIFGQVSPEMHEEFSFAYEREFLSRHGLTYYGCCEPLHGKMDMLATLPNLRKISISPWCRADLAAERAARRYVFSHKPNPAFLAAEAFDEAGAENDIRTRLEQSRGMPCEFIMKDISTLRGDVHRLIAWCKIASRCCRAWRG